MLPFGPEKDLRGRLGSIVRIGGKLPTTERIIPGPHGSERKISPVSADGFVRISDAYPDGSRRMITYPTYRLAFPGNLAIMTEVSANGVAAAFPTFKTSWVRDIRVTIDDESMPDLGFLHYDTTSGGFKDADVIIQSNATRKDTTNEDEFSSLNNKIMYLKSAISLASPSEISRAKESSELDFEVDSAELIGQLSGTPSFRLLQEDIVPAVIRTMIDNVAQDQAEAADYLGLLNSISFDQVLLGRILHQLGTTQTLNEVAEFWDLTNLAADLPEDEFTEQALLFNSLPESEQQSRKAAILTNTFFVDAINEALDNAIGSFSRSEEVHVKVSPAENGGLLMRTYDRTATSIDHSIAEDIAEPTTIEKGSSKSLSTNGQKVTLQLDETGTVATLSWGAENRRDRAPETTITFRTQVATDALVAKAVDFDVPPAQVIDELGAKINRS